MIGYLRRRRRDRKRGRRNKREEEREAKVIGKRRRKGIGREPKGERERKNGE